MARKIEEIDKNLAAAAAGEADAVYYDCMSDPFVINGLFEPRTSGKFIRLPEKFLTDDTLNDGVKYLMYNTAGGRIRFATDSPYVAVRVSLTDPGIFSHMPATCIAGCDVYAAPAGSGRESVYAGTVIPGADWEKTKQYMGTVRLDGGQLREITVNLPLYSSVSEVVIGLKEGAKLEAPAPYRVEKPVVYYGSSITQGGCASRPGNCYSARLSRLLDCDHINLGFSGSARGEQSVADYIAALDMSAFVLDYDHNAPTTAHLEATHHKFYRTVREKNPALPIVMITAPHPQIVSEAKLEGERSFELSRAIIMKSFAKGIEAGDKNLYFIDGNGFFTGADSDDCTVDGTHPTDLGFMRMADSIYALLKKLI